jgi:AraC family transcriptional regulator
MGADGRPLRTLRTALATVGLYDLPAGYRMRRHVHAGAGLVLGVEGAWVGTLARAEHACACGELVVLPDGAAHHERSAAAGSRCVLVTFTPGRRDLDGATLAFLARDRRLPARAGWSRLAARLAAATAPAEIDEAVTELLVAVTPAPRPDAAERRWLTRVREALDAGEVDPGALAAVAGRSREHVYRRFRDTFGVAPGAYVRMRRLERAARLLLDRALPVAAVAAECGFADESHLARWFRARFGVAPGRFRAARPESDVRRSTSGTAVHRGLQVQPAARQE